ncbi:Zn-dependent protease (includes SpoIVFB) [Actinopolyspora lacussalsi subsp. righensis]|uniref:Zinc metalloprotease n=1 Tax=Actinopolyspora righensis TaxID=995060 RepID=A0A1I6X5W5_9ACTN|nr:site-2 protease family protein [Actinopolyspora righensis]SFT33599.1 Zn-dependent protease (includes SpoIVFB) [Actinopolyspora righensis]
MTGTIPLGRVAGIRLQLHWSVAGIIGLIVFMLGAYWLPTTLPGHATVFYWIASTAAALLLIVSVLLHELAHALVAVRHGLSVDRVTLWLLGGVARLRGEAPTPRAELFISGVGPLVSGAVAGAFALATWVLVTLQAGQLVIIVAAYLGMLNLAIMVFNLLPAAPLDGGRILRAVIWARTGQRFKAALWATRTGAGLGFLLIAGGFVSVVTRGIEGIWAMLVGLFVLQAAAAERQQARLGMALGDVRIDEFVTTGATPRWSDLSVSDVLNSPFGNDGSVFAVVDRDGTLRGVLSPRRLHEVPVTERNRNTLRELADPLSEFTTASRGEPVTSVLARYDDPRRSILVLDQGRAEGLVPATDLNRLIAERVPGPAAHRAGISPDGAGGRGGTEPDPPSDWWYPGQRRGQ